jgi:hypothetical protein
MNEEKVKKLRDLIEVFVSGKDCSLGISGKIEVALDELFPDDEEIQNFVTCFASYHPGGGKFLYDEDMMLQECKVLIQILQSKFNVFPTE